MTITVLFVPFQPLMFRDILHHLFINKPFLLLGGIYEGFLIDPFDYTRDAVCGFEHLINGTAGQDLPFLACASYTKPGFLA